uniref:Uncharacterized protein n=1 Tax=Arundo donax TaxID=35708 RepID=A0A0A9EE33_ARUDO
METGPTSNPLLCSRKVARQLRELCHDLRDVRRGGRPGFAGDVGGSLLPSFQWTFRSRKMGASYLI